MLDERLKQDDEELIAFIKARVDTLNMSNELVDPQLREAVDFLFENRTRKFKD